MTNMCQITKFCGGLHPRTPYVMLTITSCATRNTNFYIRPRCQPLGWFVSKLPSRRLFGESSFLTLVPCLIGQTTLTNIYIYI